MTSVNDLAIKCEDAYSFDRYGFRAWRAACAMLRRRGHGDREVEAVMRSKFTRWAGDMGGKPYGRTSSKDLERFMETLPDEREAVQELVQGTFG